MALPLQGFVTPEQSWQGLSDLTKGIREEEARKEAERQKREAGKLASAKFLTDYLDEKKFLTGDPNDPYRSIEINKLFRDGMDLIDKGVSDSQLMMALSPKVSQLSQETQILKRISDQRKKAIDLLKSNPAINIDAVDAAFDEIYFDTDKDGNRTLKPISQLDPEENYIKTILNTKPVYTTAGVDNFFKNAQKQTVTEDITITDAKGGSRRAKVSVAKPNFMQLNIDPETKKLDETQEFIPKYDVAKDGDKEIVAEFLDKKGRPVKVELRLLNSDVFEQMMMNADARAFFMQQARDFAASMGIPITDPKVDVYTRAIAYDYAKNSPLTKGTYTELQATKEAPAPRTTNNIYTGGGKDDGTPTIDIWTDFYNDNKTAFSRGKALTGTTIPNQVWKVLQSILQDRDPRVGYSAADVKTQPSKDVEGALDVYDRNTNELLARISEEDFDIAVNKVLGVKSVRKVVEKRGEQGGGTTAPKPAEGKVDWNKYKR